MLDTNICIFTIKHRPETVIENFLRRDPGEMCVSAITCAELMYGVEKSQFPDKNRLALSLFLSPLIVLPFDAAACAEYGRIRARLEKQGTPIGPMDTLIAAHAKSQNLILVTNNTREFLRVPALPLEDWTQAKQM